MLPATRLQPSVGPHAGVAGATLALSRGADLVFVHDRQGARLLQGDREVQLAVENAVGAVAFEDQVWLAHGHGELVVERFGADGDPLGEALALGRSAPLASMRGGICGAPAAVVVGERTLHVRLEEGRLIASELEADADLIAPISDRRWLAWSERGLWLRWDEGAQRLCDPAALGAGPRRDLAPLFDGKAAALLGGERGEQALMVIDLRSGAVQHRVHAGLVTALRVADRRAWAVLRLGAQRVCVVDLRYGRVLAELSYDREVADLAVDADGSVLVLQLRRADGSLETSCAELPALIKSRQAVPVVAVVEPDLPRHDVPSPPPRRPLEVRPLEVRPGEVCALEVPRAVAAIDLSALCRVELAAFGARPVASTWSRERIEAQLESALELVGAWCKRALTVGWDTGRIGFAAGARPFEDEAAALLDGAAGRATELRVEAERRAGELERAFELDPSSPLGAIATEYGLSPLAQRLLLVAAAPQLRGELARVYALVRNDPDRPLCDELLAAQLLAARGAARRALARELDPDAALVRHGLVLIGSGRRPFAALEISPLVVQRIAGESTACGAPNELAVARPADRTLAELTLPPELVRRAVLALARPSAAPARIVVRARPGHGGTSLAAALAAQAGRVLGVLDVAVLAARGSGALGALRVELEQAALRGFVPCLVEVDALAGDDPARRAALRELLAAHPGPLVLRLPPGAPPPVAPPCLLLDVPTPGEADRAAAWRAALERSGGPKDAAEELAAKYRVGPGTIERVVRAAADAAGEDATALEDATARIESTLRQHCESRIGDVATRVARLASWSSVVLPDDVLASIREFIGRVAHRRTVFEHWGYDRVLTSARGLTALFSGGPGTGKSMVAGIIARELGYELYRVDLSRVLSKWVGETEKNLARVFDAAEDGEVVLLFDEADSLFAKRTPDVRGANDRYSNLEVNYLLERIDQFEGVAILTTNSSTAIDPAFKRRLSFRLSFPFPDEELREQLWRAHLPDALPIEGELDLRRLAQRYQLSGGYIRNAAVRAAFLAAEDGRAVTQEHLERAVVLEYREVGKLIDGGLLE